ncbi:MAG: GNAT family N-acetyltransferase [Gammaproteobacteria bacterium]|jgi:ribosomal protein S18 acetylase RimI-like enzyme
MSEIDVCRAGSGDLDELTALFDAYRVFYEQPSDPEACRQFLARRMANDESVIWLARQNEQAIGFVQLYPMFSSVGLGSLWVLNDLYVDSGSRGQGAGARLLERAADHARETGARGLTLETAKDNPARRLYERLGWQSDAHFVHYNLDFRGLF